MHNCFILYFILKIIYKNRIIGESNQISNCDGIFLLLLVVCQLVVRISSFFTLRFRFRMTTFVVAAMVSVGTWSRSCRMRTRTWAWPPFPFAAMLVRFLVLRTLWWFRSVEWKFNFLFSGMTFGFGCDYVPWSWTLFGRILRYHLNDIVVTIVIIIIIVMSISVTGAASIVGSGISEISLPFHRAWGCSNECDRITAVTVNCCRCYRCSLIADFVIVRCVGFGRRCSTWLQKWIEII